VVSGANEATGINNRIKVAERQIDLPTSVLTTCVIKDDELVVYTGGPVRGIGPLGTQALGTEVLRVTDPRLSDLEFGEQAGFSMRFNTTSVDKFEARTLTAVLPKAPLTVVPPGILANFAVPNQLLGGTTPQTQYVSDSGQKWHSPGFNGAVPGNELRISGEQVVRTVNTADQREYGLVNLTKKDQQVQVSVNFVSTDQSDVGEVVLRSDFEGNNHILVKVKGGKNGYVDLLTKDATNGLIRSAIWNGALGTRVLDVKAMVGGDTVSVYVDGKLTVQDTQVAHSDARFGTYVGLSHRGLTNKVKYDVFRAIPVGSWGGGDPANDYNPQPGDPAPVVIEETKFDPVRTELVRTLDERLHIKSFTVTLDDKNQR
jgi:hypothetical protein